MLEKFKETILADYPDIANLKLFLAVSGGKDSMVLSFLLRELDLEHTLLHCNFKLRGKESDDDEQFLLAYAKTYDLQIEVKRFDTYEIAEKERKTIQETARDLRYKWFRTFIQDSKSLVLTAHHLDDSVETLFINLLRGTGFAGVQGIAKLNGPFYRPLIDFSSEDIFKLIDAKGIEYREDSSNAELKYLRNRLRHTIIPLLMEIEPDFKIKMRAYFKEMSGIATYLENKAKDFRSETLTNQGDQILLKISSIINSEPVLLQFALKEYGIKRSNVDTFMNFAKSSIGSTFLTGTHSFSKDREAIFISEYSETDNSTETIVNNVPAEIYTISGLLKLESVHPSNLTFDNNPIQVDFEKVNFPLLIRNWKHGDKITPLGMAGKKLISDILIDNKIPQFRKHKTLIIEDHTGKIICIPGLMINEFFKADQFTKSLLQITLVP